MKGSEAQTSISDFRVTKKMSTTARGAIKLARQYGDSLVCVRYRSDQDGTYRYTTVELLVDRSPIRRTGDTIVSVKTEMFEAPLRSRLLARGAVWDPAMKLWRLPRRLAVELGLSDRIIRQRQ